MEGNSFTLFVSSHPGGGGIYLGVPTLAGGDKYLGREGTYLGREGTYLGRGYLPWQGVPTLYRGYLPWTGGTHLGRGSTGSTCHVAGGMPLAFTQEDCLVGIGANVDLKISSYTCHQYQTILNMSSQILGDAGTLSFLSEGVIAVLHVSDDALGPNINENNC